LGFCPATALSLSSKAASSWKQGLLSIPCCSPWSRRRTCS